MSNISNIGDVYSWSIAKIAKAFGMDRKAVKRQLLEANIPIAGTVRGNAVYANQRCWSCFVWYRP